MGHINLLADLVLTKYNCWFDLCLPLRRALLILFFIAVRLTRGDYEWMLPPLLEMLSSRLAKPTRTVLTSNEAC